MYPTFLSWCVCEVLIPRGITGRSGTKQRTWLVVARVQGKKKDARENFLPRGRQIEKNCQVIPFAFL